MNPTVNPMHHHMDGENPMMMFLMLMLMAPGMFGGMGQNPMMMIMLLMMMGGGKLF